jgi:hypothetical protein
VDIHGLFVLGLVVFRPTAVVDRDINLEIGFVFGSGLGSRGKIDDYACAEMAWHVVLREFVFDHLPAECVAAT